MTNKSERYHLDRVASTGCVICREETGNWVAGQVHHIADGTNPRSHYMTACLCEPHHQGNLPQTGTYNRVALHKGVKQFCRLYGLPNEYYLLELQNKFLAIDSNK